MRETTCEGDKRVSEGERQRVRETTLRERDNETVREAPRVEGERQRARERDKVRGEGDKRVRERDNE